MFHICQHKFTASSGLLSAITLSLRQGEHHQRAALRMLYPYLFKWSLVAVTAVVVGVRCRSCQGNGVLSTHRYCKCGNSCFVLKYAHWKTEGGITIRCCGGCLTESKCLRFGHYRLTTKHHVNKNRSSATLLWTAESIYCKRFDFFVFIVHPYCCDIHLIECTEYCFFEQFEVQDWGHLSWIAVW